MVNIIEFLEYCCGAVLCTKKFGSDAVSGLSVEIDERIDDSDLRLSTPSITLFRRILPKICCFNREKKERRGEKPKEKKKNSNPAQPSSNLPT
jgi:hypothetical protein